MGKWQAVSDILYVLLAQLPWVGLIEQSRLTLLPLSRDAQPETQVTAMLDHRDLTKTLIEC